MSIRAKQQLPHSGSRRTPGRPTIEESEALRGRIVEAAIEVFADHGFEMANMAAIAESAEVTKTTIYRLYGSKENLFKQAIHAALLANRVEHRAIDLDRSPEEVLNEAAAKISQSYMHGMVGRLWHSVLSAKHRLPEFHDEVIKILRADSLAASLAVYFADLAKTGRFDIPDPLMTAHHFALLVGQGRELALAPHASPEMEADRVAQIVAMFIKGHEVAQEQPARCAAAG